MKSHVSSEAGINDLNFVQDTINFTAETVMTLLLYKKILKHSWCLAEETAVYPIFSNTAEFNDVEKMAMVRKLLHYIVVVLFGMEI